jgi:hypothetical protein
VGSHGLLSELLGQDGDEAIEDGRRLEKLLNLLLLFTERLFIDIIYKVQAEVLHYSHKFLFILDYFLLDLLVLITHQLSVVHLSFMW